LPSTVLIVTDHSLGSGVIINEHCVATAKHMVEKDIPQHVVETNHKEYLVTKYYEEEFSDFAVMCVEGAFDGKPVRVRATMPEIYSPVFTIGNPLGILSVQTEGRYQGDDIITAPIAFGNSGGGVFDAGGNLIGIVSGTRLHRIEDYVFLFPHLGVIVTIRDIVPFLNENHILFSPAQQ